MTEKIDFNSPEVMVVAGALLNPSLVPEATRYVDKADFEDRRLGLIWSAIVSMIESGEPIDNIDVMAIAKRCAKGIDLQRKIALFASSLLDSVPRLVSLLNVASRVRRRATMRVALEGMRRVAVDIKEQLSSMDGDMPDLDGQLAKLSIEVSSRADRSLNRTEYQDMAIEVSKYFDALAVSDTEGHIQTGLFKLDRKLGGGLRPGQLHSILGSTGSGKTALASQICDEAVSRGKRAIMFSMEVDPIDIYIRDVERTSGVSRWRLRSTSSMDRESALGSIAHAQNIILGKSGKIVYGEPMSVEGIRQAILTEQLRGGKIDVVAVDHAQVADINATDRRTMPRYLEVKSIAEGMRAIARQLGVAVVLTAQLNPSPKGEKPSKDLVRESKDINNCSEVVILIWHEKKDLGEDVIIEDSWLIVDKCRAGTEGKIPIRYRGEMYKFEDVSYQGAEYGARLDPYKEEDKEEVVNEQRELSDIGG